MNNENAGKRVVVIGATSGIGRGIVEAAAKEGHQVAYGARRENLLEEIAAELSNYTVHPFRVDVSNYEGPNGIQEFMSNAYDAMGGIDVVIYNAGKVKLRSVTEHSARDIQLTGTVNWTGALLAMKSALEYFENDKHAGLFLVTSSHAAEEMFPGQGPYVGSKAGINAAVISEHKALASSTKPYRVAALNVGHVNTAEAVKELGEIFPDFVPVLQQAPSPFDFANKYVLPIFHNWQSRIESKGPILDGRTMSESDIERILSNK